MLLYNTDVDILVNGRPVKQYPHQGKVFIEAKHWTEYSIRIRNNDCMRRLFVVSVDGLNVLDGEAGGTTKAGYVINGYNSLEIKGFRTSNDIVHPFKFNRKERSYAAKSDVTEGDTSNCGVIGIEVYTEKITPPPIQIREVIREVPVPTPYPVYPWPNYRWFGDSTLSSGSGLVGMGTSAGPTYTCSINSIQHSASRRGGEGNMLRAMNFAETSVQNSVGPMEIERGFDTGTEFSEREVVDKVRDVEFSIGYKVVSLLLYYASREALVDMGVPMTKTTQVSFPEAFPTKFCRPPRGKYNPI